MSSDFGISGADGGGTCCARTGKQPSDRVVNSSFSFIGCCWVNVYNEKLSGLIGWVKFHPHRRTLGALSGYAWDQEWARPNFDSKNLVE